MTTQTIVVTRHPALVEILRERGLTTPTTKVLGHARREDIEGAHVIGVLPLSLARFARSITEIPLALTPEDRGVELTAERLREISGETTTSEVHCTRVGGSPGAHQYGDILVGDGGFPTIGGAEPWSHLTD